MTLIDIRQVTEVQISLEKLTKKCHQLCEESGQTYIQLKNLSGMQQVQRMLEYIVEDMQEEYQLLGKMEECLIQTAESFRTCETFVAEYVEESQNNPQKCFFAKTIIPDGIFRLLG